jgi:hypothetical protein
MRGRAFGQRGLLYAKRWSMLEEVSDARRGIADITEGLRLHSPGKERKHHLLNIRGQLYLATGQTRGRRRLQGRPRRSANGRSGPRRSEENRSIR